MQLVQDGGFAGGIQPKHHDLKLSIRETKSTRRYKQAVRKEYNHKSKRKISAKGTSIPSSRWCRGRHRTACGTPAPSAHRIPLLTARAPNFRSDFVASSSPSRRSWWRLVGYWGFWPFRSNLAELVVQGFVSRDSWRWVEVSGEYTYWERIWTVLTRAVGCRFLASRRRHAGLCDSVPSTDFCFFTSLQFCKNMRS